jgi:prepilin-type N-terminal cleavage/methylation domain-containing protein
LRERGQRLRSNAGLTLIEILVAVTLLALLSAGMLAALSMSAGSWTQARERLTLDRRIATANQLLYAQFAAVTPVLMQPPAISGAPPAPFFHGEPKQMRFVSSYSLDAGPRGGLTIVELNVQNAKEGERLVLTQSPYHGPFSTGRYATGTERVGPGGLRILYSPVKPRSDSLIVADQLASCVFEYQREPRTPSEPAEWLPFWGDPNQLPSAIRVRLTPAKQEARLQPVAITAEVRARYAPPFSPGQIRGPQLERDVIEVRTPNGTILRRAPR